MIPSQNSTRIVAHALRKMQHQALRDAIIFERAEDVGCAQSLRLQADDFHQVATMLEGLIIKPKTRTKKP